MSRLEHFIRQNRDAFDDEIPSDKLWEKVASALPQQKEAVVEKLPGKLSGISPVVKWSAAASVVLLVGFAVFYTSQKPAQPAVTAVENRMDTSTQDIAAVMPEAAPEVNQFAKLIAVKQEELKALSKDQPELYKKFAADINQLDSSYRALKNQLSLAPNREMLIEAMIQNLQLQLNVLNRQLHIINQIKNSKKYSHEKIRDFI